MNLSVAMSFSVVYVQAEDCMYGRSIESVSSASPLNDLKGTLTFAVVVGFYLIYNNLRTGDRMYTKVDIGEPCISVLVEVDTNTGLLTRRPKYISTRFSSLIKFPSICHNGIVPSRCSRPK